MLAPRIALAAILLATASPALPARVSGFAIVNQVGAPISGLALRRVGSSEWLPLVVSAAPGASVKAPFDNPDCAFDLKASVGGAELIWRGVNLCDVKSVTLHRGNGGQLWVDYD